MHGDPSNQERAAATIGSELLAYVAGGAETETTLRRNRRALDTLALTPRILNDVSTLDTSVELLGVALDLPVLLAPVGSVHLLHTQGPAGVARAAAARRVAYGIGSANPGAAGLPAQAGTAAFYQLYVEGDDDWVAAQCRNAREQGYTGVVITVDAPVFPVRRRDVASNNHAADRSRAQTSAHRRSFDWRSFEALARTQPGLPLIIKGIQDPADVQRAYDAGAAGIYLSNHGGRQFDHGPGAIDLVAPAAQVLRGRVPLIVDGGFESGIDVLKALAQGADIVGLGRAYVYPYAAGGMPALDAFLDTLAAQIRTGMALLGVNRIEQLRSIRASAALDVDVQGKADGN